MKALAWLGLAAIVILVVSACEGDNEGDTSSGAPIGGGGGVIKEHKEVFDSLPVYPGSSRAESDVSSGGESLAQFSVPASPDLVVPFYQDELTPLGWRAVGDPRVLPSTDDPQLHVAQQTFSKDRFTLTVYAHERPPTGAEPGTFLVQFRLQEQ